MVNLTTRQLNDDDFSFCWSLYAAAVKPLITPILPRLWNDTDEERLFRSIWKVEEAHMILYDDRPIGWFSVKENQENFVIEHGYIEQSYQKRKIGSIIIDFLVGEAGKHGKNVVVEVLQNNPARLFFDKAGFSEVGPVNNSIQFIRHT